MVIPCIFEEAEPFKNKTAVVSVKEHYGLISESQDTLIPFQYEDLSDPVEDICIFIQDEQSGYVSRTGKRITEAIYDFAGEFNNGYAVVGKDEKFGLIRKNGVTIVKLEYDQLIPAGNGLYRANLANKWGIINGMGEVVVPISYTWIADFSEGKALLVKNGKCGFISMDGKIIIPLNFIYSENLLNTGFFKNNYVLLKQKNKSLLLDSTGTKLLSTGYEDVGMISEGLIPVRKNKKWGYSSISGKLIIPCKFQEASPFENGLAKIVIKNQVGIIDTTGKSIIPPIFEDIQIKPNCFITKEHGLYGLQSLAGVMLLPRDYDKINLLTQKTAEAIKGENKTYINFISGKIILKNN